MEREVIGQGQCSGCGRDVDVKVNKNGKAYYYCTPCGHHERFGQDNTQKLKQQFNKGVENEVSTETKQPKPEPEQQSGSDTTGKEPSGNGFFFS